MFFKIFLLLCLLIGIIETAALAMGNQLAVNQDEPNVSNRRYLPLRIPGLRIG